MMSDSTSSKESDDDESLEEIGKQLREINIVNSSGDLSLLAQPNSNINATPITPPLHHDVSADNKQRHFKHFESQSSRTGGGVSHVNKLSITVTPHTEMKQEQQQQEIRYVSDEFDGTSVHLSSTDFASKYLTQATESTLVTPISDTANTIQTQYKLNRKVGPLQMQNNKPKIKQNKKHSIDFDRAYPTKHVQQYMNDSMNLDVCGDDDDNDRFGVLNMRPSTTPIAYEEEEKDMDFASTIYNYSSAGLVVHDRNSANTAKTETYANSVDLEAALTFIHENHKSQHPETHQRSYNKHLSPRSERSSDTPASLVMHMSKPSDDDEEEFLPRRGRHKRSLHVRNRDRGSNTDVIDIGERSTATDDDDSDDDIPQPRLPMIDRHHSSHSMMENNNNNNNNNKVSFTVRANHSWCLHLWMVAFHCTSIVCYLSAAYVYYIYYKFGGITYELLGCAMLTLIMLLIYIGMMMKNTSSSSVSIHRIIFGRRNDYRYNSAQYMVNSGRRKRVWVIRCMVISSLINCTHFLLQLVMYIYLWIVLSIYGSGSVWTVFDAKYEVYALVTVVILQCCGLSMTIMNVIAYVWERKHYHSQSLSLRVLCLYLDLVRISFLLYLFWSLTDKVVSSFYYLYFYVEYWLLFLLLVTVRYVLICFNWTALYRTLGAVRFALYWLYSLMELVFRFIVIQLFPHCGVYYMIHNVGTGKFDHYIANEKHFLFCGQQMMSMKKSICSANFYESTMPRHMQLLEIFEFIENGVYEEMKNDAFLLSPDVKQEMLRRILSINYQLFVDSDDDDDALQLNLIKNIIVYEFDRMVELAVYKKEEEEEEEAEEDRMDTMNDIGVYIFSYLSQTSFVNACVVSRSWFYASRFECSRSQITLRVANVLRYLIKAKDLLDAIRMNNDIICIDTIRDTAERIDGSASEDEDTSDDEWLQKDILLSCINHTKEMQQEEEAINKPFTFPYFFASRCECGLWSSLTVLQIDLTIVSNNCLMYFIDDTLYDCFWEMALTLFRIESLQSIDLMLCDPHILLLSYILKNIKSLKISKSELKFPSIGIPKHKFLCISKVISSLSFKCKSLSTQKLIRILNAHFQHYYHPSHHNKTMDAHYIQQQSTSFCYKSLDSYILCRKTIQKPLIFDITHALYYLNRRPSDDVNTVQRLILSDVRCSSYELEIFLNRNCSALKHIEIQFSKYCVFDPNYYKLMMMNGSAPSLTTNSRSNMGHRTFNSTPSGKSSMNSPHLMSNEEEEEDSNGDEDTGFPDVTALAQNTKHNKSSTMIRIAAYLNEIFDAIVLYLNKSVTRYREYNRHRAKNKSVSLPLNTLAVSLPNHLDDDCLCGFHHLFERFESPCDEIKITNLYLNGALRLKSNKLNWMKIFESQPIESFYLRHSIYIDSFFDNLSKMWSFSLLHFEVSMSFDVNSNPSSIKRLFVSLSKCHRLQHLSLEFVQNACYQTRVLRQYSSNYAVEDKTRGTPLPQLPQPIASQNSTPSAVDERERMSISSNSYSHSQSHSNHHHHHLMEPILDIWWIHQFLTSKNIKKSIRSVKLTFNELSTKKFENATASPPKYTRWNQAHGQILRICDGFKMAVEQLIMSWFAHCPQLIECRMLRQLSTMHTMDSFNTRYNQKSSRDQSNDYHHNYRNAIDFDCDISCFDDDESYLNHADPNHIHHLVQFSIKKWKIDNLQYKGDVVGELDKLLMPEIPIG
eukprot:379922_1